VIDPFDGSQCILLNTHVFLVNYAFFLATEVVLASGTILGLRLGPSSGQKLWKVMYYQVRNLSVTVLIACNKEHI
jgi:hypothetical protein